MNAKIMVKRKEWYQNCREDWPEDERPEESLETLREKYASPPPRPKERGFILNSS
jgi:flagellar biosynthesis chaperone FliJ